jgi:hypothetical protein
MTYASASTDLKANDDNEWLIIWNECYCTRGLQFRSISLVIPMHSTPFFFLLRLWWRHWNQHRTSDDCIDWYLNYCSEYSFNNASTNARTEYSLNHHKILLELPVGSPSAWWLSVKCFAQAKADRSCGKGCRLLLEGCYLVPKRLITCRSWSCAILE